MVEIYLISQSMKEGRHIIVWFSYFWQLLDFTYLIT